MNERRIIADILRVNHAGETGAVRIYRAQRRIARRTALDLVAMLEAALSDEIRHRDSFRSAMRERSVSPCGMLGFWWLGGAALGTITALLGRDAILTCTESIERTVHGHMNDQVAWLRNRDPSLADMIATIRDEELEHLSDAAAAGGRRPGWLDTVIARATETLVWLSTYGASARLAGALR